ncbi:MAG: hypothetical protein IJU68_06955 [Bacteroidales bacterium]|nr:hypothetical protein [Bacteroidales bacterium]
MSRYRIFVELAIMMLAASCTVAEPEGAETSPAALQREITITATSGEPNTRTERAADGSVLWSPGDQISLFFGSGSDGGNVFTSQNTETARVAQFTGSIGVITGGNEVSMGNQYFWAVYPYNASASCDGTSITTILPSEQIATADTFADDLFPTMGRSTGLSMPFYNICGGIKFTVSESGITSVALQGNTGEQIAGTITACFDDNGLPTVAGITGGSDTITLSAPEGTTLQVGKAYYFVLVPTVFENGFTLTFTKDDSSTAVYNRTSKTTIKRAIFGSLSTPDADLTWRAYTPYVVSYQVADFGEYPYFFETWSREVSWSTVSNYMATTLQMDYAAFRESFTWVAGKTYCYKNGMVECTGSNDCGSVIFEKNGGSDSINDKFTISLSKAQEDNFGSGTAKTLYAQFVSAKNDVIYIGFKLKIGAKPTASFATKFSSYWYGDVNGEAGSTIRTNVRIPQSYNEYGGDDVAQYVIKIDNYWTSGQVTVNVSPAVPASVCSRIHYKYEFSQIQPRVGAAGRAITRSSSTLLSYNNTAIISMTDQSTGEIIFNYNDASKQLINWASNPTDANPNGRILYCNVDLVAYYVDSNNNNYTELGRMTIHVRFLRPITFSIDNTNHFVEGIPGGGDSIELGRFFSAEDWQGYRLFYYDSSSDTYVQGVYSGIYYCGYYGINSISIDLDHVATNQSLADGSYALLSSVNANAWLGVTNKNSGNYVPNGVFNLSLSPISNMANYSLSYQNNMGHADDYTLRIPVSLEYAWGTIEDYLFVNVYGPSSSL